MKKDSNFNKGITLIRDYSKYCTQDNEFTFCHALMNTAILLLQLMLAFV